MLRILFNKCSLEVIEPDAESRRSVFSVCISLEREFDINPPALEATVLALIYENSLEGAVVF